MTENDDPITRNGNRAQTLMGRLGTFKACDWKNVADYPDPGNASMHRWAWEFLRRNLTFQGEYVQAMDEAGELELKGETRPAWSQRPTGKVLRKWGVASIPGALHDETDSYFEFESFPRFLRRGEIDGRPFEYCPPSLSRMALEFDLSAPIAPQIERAKKLLELNQKRRASRIEGIRTRNNEAARMFPTYLRVLDALNAGVTEYRIAEEFGVADDVARNWIAKANALRDEGYRHLVEK